MSLWLVRAGRHGEQEQGALDHGVITIGWDVPDLSRATSKESVRDLYLQAYPNASKNAARTDVGQIWRFIHDIQQGDLVALPLKTPRTIALGEVIGDYEYKELAPDLKHIRRVKWLKTLPRSDFDQDLLYSLGAFMTVCQITRNDAEKRVITLLKKSPEVQPELQPTGEGEELIDVEEYAKDQIIKHIEKKFKGHSLARLVEALLQAQGYVTKSSPPGRDGGVDILAAAGSLGFDEPRLCVQVKSASSPVDVKVLRELQGVMQKVRVHQGLLVAWGGFNTSAMQEARDAFFSIRLWDQGNLLEEIFKYYHQFDDELKAELPLKKVWSLVLED